MDMNRPDLFEYSTRYFMGVDLGQSFDPTAIAIIERQKAEQLQCTLKEPPPIEYNLLHLERLPLGTPYPAQVAHVMELLRREPLASSDTMTYVDQTGVGRAVFDIFKQTRIRRLYGVTITAGEEVTKTSDGYHVAKKDLMSRLQAAMHSKELHIPTSLADGPALMKELQDFRVRFSTAGNPIFGAREGAHDDIVLATALAMFGATQPTPLLFDRRSMEALRQIANPYGLGRPQPYGRNR